jgi:hypothetical protein
MYLPVVENQLKNESALYPLLAIESRMVKKYVKFLAERNNPEILDIGPVSGNNISFFLNRVSKVHVCDVFSLIAREPGSTASPEYILSFLDYKERSLDGIHMWDIPDHLDTLTLSLLMKKLHSFLKPNALLMLMASTTSGVQPHPLYFVIREDCSVMLEKVTTRQLSYFYRANREIERCLKPFQQLNSFISINGVREFLYRNPG